MLHITPTDRIPLRSWLSILFSRYAVTRERKGIGRGVRFLASRSDAPINLRTYSRSIRPSSETSCRPTVRQNPPCCSISEPTGRPCASSSPYESWMRRDQATLLKLCRVPRGATTDVGMEIARLLVGGWSGKKIGWSYRAAMLAIAGQRLNPRKRVPRELLSAVTPAPKLVQRIPPYNVY